MWTLRGVYTVSQLTVVFYITECIVLKQITSNHMKYESHGIHTGDELEDAVCKNKSYPPVAKCEVQCSNRAYEGGQQTLVALSLKTGKNKPKACEVISFYCKTFFEEPTEGWSHPIPFIVCYSRRQKFAPVLSRQKAISYSFPQLQIWKNKMESCFVHENVG